MYPVTLTPGGVKRKAHRNNDHSRPLGQWSLATLICLKRPKTTAFCIFIARFSLHAFIYLNSAKKVPFVYPSMTYL